MIYLSVISYPYPQKQITMTKLNCAAVYCPIRWHRGVLQSPWSHPNQLLIDAFNVRIPWWFHFSMVARHSGLFIFSLKLLCCFQYLRDRLQMKQPFLTYADKGSGSLSNRNHVEVLRELSFSPYSCFLLTQHFAQHLAWRLRQLGWRQAALPALPNPCSRGNCSTPIRQKK